MKLPRRRIGPKRTVTIWFATLFILILPFVKAGGDSLLRLDAPTRTLFFFGARVRVEEFYLLLIVVLLSVFLFLFVTVVFGRVWCGWFCPQSAFSDIFEYIEKKLAKHAPPGLARIIIHLLMALFSFLVASNLIWYFVPPDEYFRRLFSGEAGEVVTISLVSIFLLIFFNLVFVRRKFCKTVCPYGRIQLMVMNSSTLTLEMNPDLAGLCIKCGACVRKCPMGIDIREGVQVECINCGRCLDACRDVMEKMKRGEGLIHYTFGRSSNGGGRPLNATSMLLAAVIILLVSLFLFSVKNRADATITIRQSVSAGSRKLPDGSLINFFNAYIENRGRKPLIFNLEPLPVQGYRIMLLGPVTDIYVGENENRKIDFMIKIYPAPGSPQKVKVLLRNEGVIAASATVALLSE